MENKKLQKIIIIVAAVFVLVSLFFMFGKTLFSSKTARNSDSTVMPEATGTTNEIRATTVVQQDFVCSTDTISKVGIVFVRDKYIEGVHLALELYDGNKLLASSTVNVAKIEEQHRTYIEPSSKLSGMKNKTLTIKIYPVEKEDTGMMIMMSNKVNSNYLFGNKTIKGSLCFSVTE